MGGICLRSTAARIHPCKIPVSLCGVRARLRPPAPHNGFDVTDAVYNDRSSIRRVPEHHMVPAEVCDGQDPAGSMSCGREIDITLPPPLAAMAHAARQAPRNGFDVIDAVYNARVDQAGA